jgi:predicted Rossmann fold nucleotide-binding protein DprA/Smf involved in DNA uptake
MPGSPTSGSGLRLPDPLFREFRLLPRLSNLRFTYRSRYSARNLRAVGNRGIADSKKLALFCSKKCPGTLIIQTHDLAHALRDARITVIGGFHSPVEKECLNVLLKGTQPLIICPARSLEGMRVPAAWRIPIEQGRLLLLSPFEKKHRRPTTDLAQKRNEFVAALADAVFVAYAALGSTTESLCRKLLAWNKPVLTFDCSENASLIALGARPVRPDSVMQELCNLGF